MVSRPTHTRMDNVATGSRPLLSVKAVRAGRRNGHLGLLVVMAGAFFLTFSAFNAAQTLDGSIPAPQGLAAFQFMVLYGVFALLCIPAPKILARIGPKACIAVGMLTYLGLIMSFLAPRPCEGATDVQCWSVSVIWTLRMTTAVILGCGAAIIWCGQGVYLGRLAAHAAEAEAMAASAPLHTTADVSAAPAAAGATQELLSQITKRYNGIFWSSFQFSGAAGLSASSLVLIYVPGDEAVTYLFIALSCCCTCGVLCVIFFLPALPPVAPADDETDGAPILPVTLFSTLRLCSHPRMLLIVPNIFYNGLSLAFNWYLYSTFIFNTALVCTALMAPTLLQIPVLIPPPATLRLLQRLPRLSPQLPPSPHLPLLLRCVLGW